MSRVIAMLALVAVASAAFAMAPATKPASAPASVKGAFVKMDGAKLLMKVKEGDKIVDKTVLTTDKTTVKVGDAEGKLADLKEGQEITVTLDDKATEPTAASVKTRAAAPAKNAK
jgi:hypothetical protein